jgi:hypothetical protein
MHYCTLASFFVLQYFHLIPYKPTESLKRVDIMNNELGTLDHSDVAERKILFENNICMFYGIFSITFNR